jgi:dGTPase
VRGVLDWSVSGLIEGTTAAAAALADVESVREHPLRVARFSPPAAEASGELKRFLRAHVYESQAVVEGRSESISRIEPLFETLLAHPERLPESYLAQAEGQPLYRTVCDYIAGMTDGFFERTCVQLGIE